MAKKNMAICKQVQDDSESLDSVLTAMINDELSEENLEAEESPVVEEHRPDAFEGQYERLGLSVDNKGQLLAPRRLNEVIDLLDDNEPICIGAASSFFFIGTVAEYKRDIGFIEAYYKATSKPRPSRKNKSETDCPLRERLITEIYSRDLPGEPLTKRFTIVGYEVGKLWLRSEYPREFDKMVHALVRVPANVVKKVDLAKKEFDNAQKELEKALEAVKEAERNLYNEYDDANERIDYLVEFFKENGTDVDRAAFAAGLVRPSF